MPMKQRQNTQQIWHPLSWESCHTLQRVDYPDFLALAATLTQLKTMPPLVPDSEIQDLKMLLQAAEKGEAFILQGGDCSELFADCHPQHIAQKFDILLKMRTILMRHLKKPVIQIGRIAGQYAKPRSVSEETVNGVTLPAYRGDMIHDYAFNKVARTPDPTRMLRAYQYSALTLHELHRLIIANNVQFFSSHEALHLPYESALTREVTSSIFYNMGTHFPWVGMRTLRADGAHIEYLRGIENPVGIKVGPDVDLNELMQIIDVLNPEQAHGKIVLIHRFGKAYIEKKLPQLLEKLTQENKVCAVMCDPMHGNTRITAQGIKTRDFDDIVTELCNAFYLHQVSAIPLAGMHVEITGDNVTECIGGTCGLQEADLGKTYTSLVDPRLNYQQSLEIARKMAALFQPGSEE